MGYAFSDFLSAQDIHAIPRPCAFLAAEFPCCRNQHEQFVWRCQQFELRSEYLFWPHSHYPPSCQPTFHTGPGRSHEETEEWTGLSFLLALFPIQKKLIPKQMQITGQIQAPISRCNFRKIIFTLPEMMLVNSCINNFCNSLVNRVVATILSPFGVFSKTLLGSSFKCLTSCQMSTNSDQTIENNAFKNSIPGTLCVSIKTSSLNIYLL